MANYYVDYTSKIINPNETWGQQDLDGDGIGDGGNIPLEMKLYPNTNCYVLAEMFTMKGYAPTGFGPSGERIWQDGETTTDANGNSVVVSFTNVDKVEMFDAIAPTMVEENNYDSSNVQFLVNLNPQGMCTASSGNPYSPPEADFGANMCDGGDANVMINLEPEEILLDGTPITTGDLVGIFKNEDGIYKSYGFIIWNDNSMPPASITVRGPSSYGWGFDEGDEMHVFIKRASDENIFKLDVNWFSEDAVWGWADGNLGYTDSGLFKIWEVYSATNWTQNDLIPSPQEGNFVIVKAWLKENYTTPTENTELTLDIDGDGVLIPPSTSNDKVNVTLEMVAGDDSNCIVHVYARSGASYNSGNHVIPSYSEYIPFGSEIANGADITQYTRVSSIIQTGIDSKATVELKAMEGSDNSLITGICPSCTDSQDDIVQRLDNLFLFIIEPKPGFALHQGWVAPMYKHDYKEYNNTICAGSFRWYGLASGAPDANIMESNIWQNGIQNDPIVTWYGIYNNSPVSLMPGGENYIYELPGALNIGSGLPGGTQWYNCTKGQGTSTCNGWGSDPDVFTIWNGNTCWWPSFKHQWTKCKCGDMTDYGVGNNCWDELGSSSPGNAWGSCRDCEGNDPDYSYLGEEDVLGYEFGSANELANVGFARASETTTTTTHVTEAYDGFYYDKTVIDNGTGQAFTGNAINPSDGPQYSIRFRNTSHSNDSDAINGSTPWAQDNCDSNEQANNLIDYSVSDFSNNCVIVGIGRSLINRSIGEQSYPDDVIDAMNEAGIAMTNRTLSEVKISIGGKALPINDSQGSEDVVIIIDEDDLQ